MPKLIDLALTKQTILKQAMELFAQKGFAGLSMRHLATGLSMTTGALYHHFRNKDQLYTEMIQMLASQDADSLYHKAAEAQGPEQVVAVLRDFLTQRSSYFMQILLLVFDHQRYIRDPENTASPAFCQIFSQTLELYLQALLDVLQLPSEQEAQILLDYLIGNITRAMIQQHPPDFSALPLILPPLLARFAPDSHLKETPLR